MRFTDTYYIRILNYILYICVFLFINLIGGSLQFRYYRHIYKGNFTSGSDMAINSGSSALLRTFPGDRAVKSEESCEKMTSIGISNVVNTL